jgi:hypothetical protein
LYRKVARIMANQNCGKGREDECCTDISDNQVALEGLEWLEISK